MTPKSGKEAKLLGMPRYFTGVPCKRGHLSERYANGGHCIQCDNERIRPEESRKSAIKRYYNSNKEKCHAANKAWKKTSCMAYEYVKRNRNRNPGLVISWNAKRRSAKKNRTPDWLNDGHLFEMDCIYKYCGALRKIGLDYVVDHIIPLQGENVSGLHVPWNLQILTDAENSSKGNRL